MTAYSHGLLSYLWHYLVARLIFDELVRPLGRGNLSAVLPVLAALAVSAFLLGRLIRRSRR